MDELILIALLLPFLGRARKPATAIAFVVALALSLREGYFIASFFFALSLVISCSPSGKVSGELAGMAMILHSLKQRLKADLESARGNVKSPILIVGFPQLVLLNSKYLYSLFFHQSKLFPHYFH